MKTLKWAGWMGVALGVMGLAIAAFAAEMPMEKQKAKETTLKGKMMCAMCSMADPKHECTKECCQACTKNGSPTLFKDAKGQVYLLMPGEHGKDFLTDDVKALFGEEVTLRGRLAEVGGLKGIFVDSVAKAPAA